MTTATSRQVQLIYDRSKLAHDMEAGEDLVVVDGRPRDAFKAEHIPGSVNIPHREIRPDVACGLDRHKIHVCYCDGRECKTSIKAALRLLTLGFEVRKLYGGLEWWKRDGYATSGTRGQPGKAPLWDR